MDAELAFYSSVLAKSPVRGAAEPLRNSPSPPSKFSGPGADTAWLKEDGDLSSGPSDDGAAASPAASSPAAYLDALFLQGSGKKKSGTSGSSLRRHGSTP